MGFTGRKERAPHSIRGKTIWESLDLCGVGFFLIAALVTGNPHIADSTD